MSMRDDTIHICNDCGNQKHFPACMPETVQFGNGFGNDNIIACKNHSEKDTIAEIKKGYIESVEADLAARDVVEKQDPNDPDTSEIPC